MTRAVPKPTPPSKRSTGASAKRYKDWLAQHPCIVCGATPVELHHVKSVRSPKTGLPLKPRDGIADVAMIPLCAEHHKTGSDSVHALGEFDFALRHLSGPEGAIGHAAAFLAAYVIERG